MAEAIANVGRVYPQNGFTFQNAAGRETRYTFAQIASETARRAGALHRLGLRSGERLALIATDPEHFVLTFLAAVRIGVIPVPLSPPMYVSRLDGYLAQTESIMKSSSAKLVAISGGLRDSLAALAERLGEAVGWIDLESLMGAEEGFTPADTAISPDDVAFLQYTSGSTAEPRGVVVTHRCLISNARAFIAGLGADPVRDRGVTWLPLYHDMGLIGFVLAPIYTGISVVFIPTHRFVRNPNVWMDAIHAHRGTISFAPNFAFDLACRKAADVARDQWDLSCVRALGCGAEPIRSVTIERFLSLFGERWGLPATCIVPAYGLAESTLAVTMKPPNDAVRVLRIDRTVFEAQGRAIPALDGAVNPLLHVSSGAVFPGHELAIMDPAGVPLADLTEGEISLRGPSIAAGYFGAAAQSWRDAMLPDGWLRTGDLGYLADGELYVTGRIKDLIILNGRNIHPQEIERLASGVNGVREGGVAAFARPGDGGEEVVVVAEARGDRAAIADRIALAIQQDMAVTVSDVVCVKPGSLARTTSGKLRRHQIRKRYLSNSLQQ